MVQLLQINKEMEDIEIIIGSTKESMEGAINHLIQSFIKIRAGKASPQMLSSVKIEYYGSLTPLSQVANVNSTDAMTLVIQPWEKPLLGEIEKAIINSNLGFAPSNNGDQIIINVPPLTEERRKELVKQAKSEAENAKVSIRNARKDANNQTSKVDGIAEDLVKNTEVDIQELTDGFIKKIDEIFTTKEKEILTL